MTKRNRPSARLPFGARVSAAALCATALLTITAQLATAESEPATTGGPVVVRRLAPEQYRQSLNDIFGRDIKLGARFETEVRENGLLAVGARHVSVTATGFERYDAMARSIASQVVDEKHRATLIPCKPASATDADDACATQFLAKTGRLLYRRPLTPQEIKTQVEVASAAAKTLKSFYSGLGLSLADMLESPQFLFRRGVAEADPVHSGQFHLNAYSKASQISFLLWNSGPDAELLASAENGDLNTERGLAKQVDRLLASPRVEAGLRAFFTDMLQLDDFSTLSKDAAIYPKFTTDVARDAQEQTLRTITDHLLTRKGDYRDLFTTRNTFLTPVLGTIYRVPIPPQPEIDSADPGWQPYSFPEGDPRAGILSEASFVSLHSHPGRSSPTLRGKALREIILCQKVPDPPANVNFTVVQDTKNPLYKTARERVTAHRTDPVCAGCHKLIDPMGLALENFDSSGGYRETENGVKIDASGELDGVKFTDAAGLAKAVHDSPATPSCVVNRLYAYATGRPSTKGESDWFKYLDKSFAADGYRVPDLLRRIATSEALYRVSAPQTGALELPAARLASQLNIDRATISQEGVK